MTANAPLRTGEWISKEITHDRKRLFAHTAVLYKRLLNIGAEEQAGKLLDLLEKINARELGLAFTGHFSAGKSTLINTIMDEPILPSSPIPTSANLVKIKPGKHAARIYYTDREPVEFQGPYDYEKIQAYSRDGDAVSSIEIFHPFTDLPEGLAVMDTPGIDSTDEAHRIATESALHLADTIFYVVDYNHVQSELNFRFVEELKESHKPVYVVVNQIDKHRDEELPFEEYQKNVNEAFKSWNVEPDGIFYVSSLYMDAPHNQYRELHDFIQSLIHLPDEEYLERVADSIKGLIAEALEGMEEDVASETEEAEHQLEHLSAEERKEVAGRVGDLHSHLGELEQGLDHVQSQFLKGIQEILENAYIMPAQTRDLARSYLESRDPSFKTGFFFQRSKTEKEREERLQAFYDDFSRQVATHIDGHFKQYAVDFLKEKGIEDDSLFKQIYDAGISFDPELLADTVKSGATANGQYVLNYTNDVSNRIKQMYRQKANDIIRQAEEDLKGKTEKELAAVEEELQTYKKWDQALQVIEAASEKLQKTKAALAGSFSGDVPADDIREAEELAGRKMEQTRKVNVINREESGESIKEEHAVDSEPEAPRTAETVDDDSPSSTESFHQMRSESEDLSARLESAASLVEPLGGFKQLASDLKSRAKRLKNQQFTVALFGAFSAGKSSFANALMGEGVLPVSPNPTTAAINRIMPPDSDYSHGTVRVKLKTAEQLLKDMNASFKVLHKQEAGSLEEAMGRVKELQAEKEESSAHTERHFLNAAAAGYSQFRDNLGETVEAGLEEYRSYVAEEAKAVFVEWIDLYYDCPLTKEGITIVDTPGADSINARHTGVAFNYIKNADAIFFVTYYNHAFSHADREFLIQLGRVKDTFELDKMFFIINAADLAKNASELNMVKEYVEGQLSAYGIRNPRTYGVSSKNVLKAKQAGSFESEDQLDMHAFENEFFRFIEKELVSLSLEAARADLDRTKVRVEKLIASAQQGDAERHDRLEQVKKAESDLISQLENMDGDVERRSLQNEVEELFFYIKQRVFLRYQDEFKEYFNPAVLNGTGGRLKDQLQDALDDLLGFVEFDLIQEMRATTLRVEADMNRKLKNIHEEAMLFASRTPEPPELSSFEPFGFTSLEFKEAEAGLEPSGLKQALGHYKNGKQLFEQQGIKEIKESLENRLQEPVKQYLDEKQAHFSSYYTELFTETVKEMTGMLKEEAGQYYGSLQEVLGEQVDIEKLKSVSENLEN